MFKGSFRVSAAIGVCPERKEKRYNWLDRVASSIAGAFAPVVRPGPKQYEWIVDACKEQESAVQHLTDAEIPRAASDIGWQLRREGYRNDLVARSFALTREAARRHLGTSHFDVQLMGGLVLLKGLVAEMETGEGKTLTATLAASTAALAGEPVHIVTVNDYLAERDAHWMEPIYKSLGLTVGIIIHGLTPAARRTAYQCDVVYCTNKELAFDYLKDRIVLWDRPGEASLQLERFYGDDSRVNRLIMRGLRFAIIDEADSVLIDEARTPLIISSGTDSTGEREIYEEAYDLATRLSAGEDFSVISEDRDVELTSRGKAKIAEHLWSDKNMWTSREQQEELVRQALVAINLFTRDKHYLVTDGKVQIVDEYTGRVMADRSWERGLHQFIEAKEGVEMTTRKDTLARISYQRFFRRYLRLAGMTGTAKEVAGELWTIYRLRVVTIPTNRPVYRHYLPEKVYFAEEDKWKAIVETVMKQVRKGQPILVGTRSVAASEHLSELLTQTGLPHQVLNARQDREEAEIIAQAGNYGCITVATNMAGRGTDIKLDSGVADLGGLYVIVTEFHESHRIDRQLFGRAGRQGDPGLCQAIVSLEDELISVYGWAVTKRLARIFPASSNGCVRTGAGKAMFRMAQRTAERVHSRARRNLLKMDEQLGDVLAFSGRQE
jgi:preprotein translocase subunit SecA